MNSFAEENYLKAIFKLLEKGNRKVYTNAIAEKVDTAPASVTDMLKKLSAKKLIHYEKYQGVSLTPNGKKTALQVIRKHRLWEYFLVQKLKFKWDEVHDIAEQLEHIHSDMLIQKLDRFLNYPKADPHGDPIPDENGRIEVQQSVPLSELKSDHKAIITGVIDHSPLFLKHIEKTGLSLGKELHIREKFSYDLSCRVNIKPSKAIIHISHDVAKNILVRLKK
ncbi:MAG: metal-dependent transcriptional regulator [Bacteroidetes bacterium]|nr:metal-dependent transcriptional regulator [Bacteroidota bacterium]